MDLVSRAKNICVSPASEWAVIENEPATTGDLLTGYALPLAAIGAIAGFIGTTMVGISLPFVGTYRVPFTTGLANAIYSLVTALVACFLLSLIIDALAPTFNGQKNQLQALKLAVYSYTPAWLAGVLAIIPALGALGILAGFYSIYVLYLGIPRLMKSPHDKAIPYTAVTIVCAIVLSIVLALVGGLFISTTPGRGFTASSGSSSDVQFDKNSPLGKLQEMAKAAEDNSKKVEAANKAGDPNAAAAAAVAGLGALLGGGQHADAVDIDVLKPLVPETFGGLKKISSNAEKNGLGGLQVSKAEARYSDGADKSVSLEISDTGGVSGLMALAGWAGA